MTNHQKFLMERTKPTTGIIFVKAGDTFQTFEDDAWGVARALGDRTPKRVNRHLMVSVGQNALSRLNRAGIEYKVVN